MRSLRLHGTAAVLTVLLAGMAMASPRPASPWDFVPQGITEPRHAIPSDPEVVEIEAHDGVTLHTRVYRPILSGPSKRVPIILIN